MRLRQKNDHNTLRLSRHQGNTLMIYDTSTTSKAGFTPTATPGVAMRRHTPPKKSSVHTEIHCDATEGDANRSEPKWRRQKSCSVHTAQSLRRQRLRRQFLQCTFRQTQKLNYFNYWGWRELYNFQLSSELCIFLCTYTFSLYERIAPKLKLILEGTGLKGGSQWNWRIAYVLYLYMTLDKKNVINTIVLRIFNNFCNGIGWFIGGKFGYFNYCSYLSTEFIRPTINLDLNFLGHTIRLDPNFLDPTIHLDLDPKFSGPIL
jgi:hypothetical protein